MRRRLLSVVLAAAVSLPSVAAIRAQDADSEATPAVLEAVDLAAMTLTPSEVDVLGFSGFGDANQSSLRDAETDALVQADGRALEAAERLAAYEEHGFRFRYLGSLLRPRTPLVRFPSGLVAADVRISTAVTEYESADGAAAGFAFTERQVDDQPGDDVPGSRTFGDESELTRSAGTETESGEPFQRLELAFRLDNLVGEVIVVDYLNVEPEVATVERLGEALLAKIERRRGETRAALSMQVLRLEPMDTWIRAARLRDYYVLKGGVGEPTFPEIVEFLEDGARVATPAPPRGFVAPEDTYLFWTPVGEGDPLDLPLYVVWLDRYGSPAQAAAALRGQSTDLGPGYVDVREFVAQERIGNESRQFSYRYDGDPSVPARGYLVIARLGNVLVRTQVDAPGAGVMAAGVRRLASAQLECLESASPCERLPSLAVLADLVAERPGA